MAVSDFLKTSFEYNRMEKESLDAMWKAVSEHKQPFFDYHDRKAQLIGKKNQLDLARCLKSPVFSGQYQPQLYPYDKGGPKILS